jgi:uncharacterized protein GlcG (DUF336 family)
MMELQVQTILTLETARDLVKAAQDRARIINKPVCVAVVDGGGFLVALERMDGARPLTPSIALAKGYTAAIMQRPGKMLKAWAESQPGFFAQVSRMGHQPIVATEGSVTIKKNGVLLGGLGVSGGTGDEDQKICEEALAASGYDTTFAEWNPISGERKESKVT